MARRPLPSLVLALAAAAVLASTARAAPSDPPAVKTAAQAAGHGAQAAPAPAKKTEPAQAAGHGAQAAPAPAKKTEPAQAADAHAAPAPKKAEASAPTGHGAAAGSTPAASHGAPAAPVKKTAKVDRKAIEAEVRQVVTRINAAMQEVAAAPAAKPATKPTGAGHGTQAVQGAPAVPARVPGKARPSPLLVWDDTLKGGNVTLVWDPELAPRPAGNGARLVWGEEKK